MQKKLCIWVCRAKLGGDIREVDLIGEDPNHENLVTELHQDNLDMKDSSLGRRIVIDRDQQRFQKEILLLQNLTFLTVSLVIVNLAME